MMGCSEWKGSAAYLGWDFAPPDKMVRGKKGPDLPEIYKKKKTGQCIQYMTDQRPSTLTMTIAIALGSASGVGSNGYEEIQKKEVSRGSGLQATIVGRSAASTRWSSLSGIRGRHE